MRIIDSVEGLRKVVKDGKFTIKGDGRPEVTVDVAGIIETTNSAYLAIVDNIGVSIACINEDNSIYGLMDIIPSLKERDIEIYNQYHREKIVKIHKV